MTRFAPLRRTTSVLAVALAAAAGLAAPAALAQDGAIAPDAHALIDAAMVAEMRDFLSHEVVILATRLQNRRHVDLDQARIDALDAEWRAQTEAAAGESRPLIARVLANPLSGYLVGHQARHLGLYPEIFVVDRFGLNVGQSAITSDYWQGDEAKFQETFEVGPDAVFIDAAEFNDTTRTWRAQVNLTLADPETGEAIGAATVEVDLDRLAERRAIASGS
jgi:hypothetical protein